MVLRRPEMMEDLKNKLNVLEQIQDGGMVTKVDLSKRPFNVEIDENKKVCQTIIIAYWRHQQKWLGIEDEKRLNGYGVSAAQHVMDFFTKEKML